MRLARLIPFAMAALLLAGAARADDVPGVTDTEIRIGTFGPMAGPGYLYGRLAMNGVEAAFAKANEAGGVNGRKLVLVREDDRCEPAGAIAAVRKLIYDDKVFAIDGGGCSNAAVAVREDVEKAGIPWVVFAAVHDGLTVPVSPVIFSPALTATIESKAQVAFARQQGAKRIAIIAMHDSWGRSRLDPLMATLKEKGITPVADEEMAPDANDATAQVLHLKAANPDAVIVVLYPKPAAVFLRDAAKFGFKPLAIGQSGIGDPAAFEEQVGVPGATANFVTIAMVKVTPDDPAVASWRAEVTRLYPDDRLSVFNLFGIGSAEVLIEALRQSGHDLTRAKFIDVMNHLTNFQTDVYGGPITCTPADHRCNKNPVWLKKDPGGAIHVVAVTPVD
ncbi:MAG: ABC transporter substrate-binding protein [Acetobacteraceae bacterium]|nr:ABC transporter substrate-binding protein [Acetobacteraceae bacterium]